MGGDFENFKIFGGGLIPIREPDFRKGPGGALVLGVFGWLLFDQFNIMMITRSPVSLQINDLRFRGHYVAGWRKLTPGQTGPVWEIPAL